MAQFLPDDRFFRILCMNPGLKTGGGSALPTLAGMDDTALARAIAANRARATYLGADPAAFPPVVPAGPAPGCWNFEIRGTSYGNFIVKVLLDGADPDDFYTIFVNERLLHVSHGQREPLVKFKLKTRFAPSARFVVANSRGVLPHASAGQFWAPDLPGARDDVGLVDALTEKMGSGNRKPRDFHALIPRGYYLTKKGYMRRPQFGADDKKRALGALCARLDAALRDGLGMGVFVSHGTLLGLVRNGDLIEHDDDFDCAYLSAETDFRMISQERIKVADHLNARGFDCRIGIQGNLKLYQEAEGLKIDLMPAWFDSAHFNISTYTTIDMAPADLAPFAEVAFHGARLNIPRIPERFLEQQYGPGWRVPDPSYRSSPSDKALMIRERFKRDQRQRPDLHERLKQKAMARAAQDAAQKAAQDATRKAARKAAPAGGTGKRQGPKRPDRPAGSALLPDDLMFRVLRMDPGHASGSRSVLPTLDRLDDARLAQVIAVNRDRAAYLGVDPSALAPGAVDRPAPGRWRFRIGKSSRGNVILRLHLDGADREGLHAVFVNERLMHASHGSASPLLKLCTRRRPSSGTRIIVANAAGIVPHASAGQYWAPDLPGAAREMARVDALLARHGATDARPRSFYKSVGEGKYLTKKGRLSAPGFAQDATKAAIGAFCARLAAALHEGFGLTVFASHGTLLGLIRDGDLIAHDDDFDCAYLSAQTDVRRISQERFVIADYLISRGFDCRIAPNGNLRLHQEDGKPMIDLMPAWFDGTHFNVASYTTLDMTMEDLAPFAKREFHGVSLNLPRNAEKFLALNYGPGWRVPDPSYRTRPGPKALGNRILFKSDQRERPDLCAVPPASAPAPAQPDPAQPDPVSDMAMRQ